MKIQKDKLYKIDSIANAGINNKAMPGCQIIAAKNGHVFYKKSFLYFAINNTSSPRFIFLKNSSDIDSLSDLLNKLVFIFNIWLAVKCDT